MATKKIRGKQLYLFLNDEPLGWSSDCSINLSAGVVEISPLNGWARFRAGRKSWTVDASGFYMLASVPPTNVVSGARMIGRKVKIAATVLKSDSLVLLDGVEAISPNKTHLIVGDAIVTKCRYSGSVGGFATYSIELQGSDAIGIASSGFPYSMPLIF